MEQKLFFLPDLTKIKGYRESEGELRFPDNLQELLKSGWRIVQVSAFGYSVGYYGTEACVLLLQKETAI